LRRLGGEQLRLDPFPEDRSLGLRSFGRLAFLAFVIVVAGFVPALVGAISSPVALFASSGLFLASLAAFFGSLWGIHGQMTAARDGYIARAQQLYVEAYEPMRRHNTLASLAEQAPLLRAADDLSKRAEGIQTWPFDEGTFARVAAIATSVATITIARLILNPLGL
jgi:hypothetical protein